MQKQKSSGMRREDDFTAATKKLIKKTLLIFGISACLIAMLAFWTIKKITSPRPLSLNTPSSSQAVLSQSAEAAVFSTPPSPSEAASPTVAPIFSSSPQPTSTLTPTPSSIVVTAHPSPSLTHAALPASTPAPVPGKTIISQLPLDGYMAGNNTGSVSEAIKVGKSGATVYRGFLSFDITQISASNIIDKATLRVYQQNVIGTPYASGGDLKVDQLNYGSTFEPSDFGTSSISSSFATLSNNPSPGWKEINVTQNLKGDLAAARVRSQYRIHFATEPQQKLSQAGDLAIFESADNTLKTGNTPQLLISFH